MREFIEYMASRGMRAEPGLDDKAISGLEHALGARLPAPMRELYRRCGGLRSERWTNMPMRLMPAEEVIETAEILRESEDTYTSSPEARYLFTDDGSNWVGIFVDGTLCGKLTILDHNSESMAPRFRDLSSFLDKLIDAGRRELDWPDMRTDYPLSPDSDASLVDEASRLSHEFLDRYRAAAILDEDAMGAADTALHLLPPAEWPTLRELMRSPRQWVRYRALRVAAYHKPAALISDLFAYAQAAQDQDNYTHWHQAFEALLATGATAEVDLLDNAAPPNWPRPD